MRTFAAHAHAGSLLIVDVLNAHCYLDGDGFRERSEGAVDTPEFKAPSVSTHSLDRDARRLKRTRVWRIPGRPDIEDYAEYRLLYPDALLRLVEAAGFVVEEIFDHGRARCRRVTRPQALRFCPQRRSIMLMRKLGRTGLRVSALCLGGNTFGWTTDQKASEAVLNACVEAGGNFIDTADVYSRWAPGNKGGESEDALGIWMTARGNRHAVLIATKVMGPMGPGPNDTGLSRQHIMEGVAASLKRLQTDYIDLYQAHWDDKDTPLDETLRAFDDLVRQGKVRYIGASNHHAWRLTRALWESDKRGYVRYESLQPKYNLVFRDEYERELEPLCLEQGVGVIPYSSLGSGFLSGKYRPGAELPKTKRAANVQKGYMNDRGFAVLAAVDKVAGKVSATVAQVALSWLAHRPGITAPIASATTVAQLKELIGGIELKLDEDATATLDTASAWREA